MSLNLSCIFLIDTKINKLKREVSCLICNIQRSCLRCILCVPKAPWLCNRNTNGTTWYGQETLLSLGLCWPRRFWCGQHLLSQPEINKLRTDSLVKKSLGQGRQGWCSAGKHVYWLLKWWNTLPFACSPPAVHLSLTQPLGPMIL